MFTELQLLFSRFHNRVFIVPQLLPSQFLQVCVFTVLQILSSRFPNSCLHGSKLLSSRFYNFCVHGSYYFSLHGSKLLFSRFKLLSSRFHNSCLHRSMTLLVFTFLISIVFTVPQLLSSPFHDSTCLHDSYNSCLHGSTTLVFAVLQLLAPRLYNSCLDGFTTEPSTVITTPASTEVQSLRSMGPTQTHTMFYVTLP